MEMDVEKACRFAHALISRTSDRYDYHNLSHTLDVEAAADLLVTGEKISQYQRDLLHTAAAYHDVGYWKMPAQHEKIGIEFAQLLLPTYGYSPSEVAIVTNAIQATKLPQHPHTHLERMLCDADLFGLHLHSFFSTAKRVRRELAKVQDKKYTDIGWHRKLNVLLTRQQYFTKTGREIGEEGIVRNLNELRRQYRNKN